MAATDHVLIGAPERAEDTEVVGYAYRAAANATDLPTSTTAALPAGADDLGFVSEDGVSISTDISTEYIKDWNLDPVRSLLTEHEATITFSLINWSEEALRAYFGAQNVDTSGDEVVVTINSKQIAPASFIFNMKDLDRKRRIVIPNAVIASQGELVFKKGEQTNLEIELQPLVDEYGEKIYIYTQKAAEAPAG